MSDKARVLGRKDGQRIHPRNDFILFSREDLEESIPERFERQVVRHANRTAIKSRYHEVTYEALNRQANLLARALMTQLGSEQEPVVLLLENDAPMIASMLGVLKAGKFYVPLELTMPRAKMAYILEDSQAGVIVTNNQNISLARELAAGRLPILNVDALDSEHSEENLGLPISPESLCWILYTSGSTGQPKGVMQNHRNIIHYVMNYTNDLHLCSDDRLSLVFTLSFNAGNHEIYCALLTGASLYPLDVKREGVRPLADWLIGQKITVHSSVPTLFRHFVGTLTGEEQFPDLRLIKMVGEPVYRRDVEAFQRYFSPNCLFVNRLGSTEVGSLRWNFIDRNTEVEGNFVPVGYAVEDNEILLLDEERKEVGLDTVGEIAVRSRYLSPGYWRKPERTEAAFLPDPKGGDERIYLTGDLGYMQPDGCLVHVGRKDFQVKIRGHRIETAEIEMALTSLKSVKESVVVAHKDRTGEQRLVAYFVSATTPSPTISELRRGLAEKLPDYMIPSSFVVMGSLPLTTSGKVNRRELPPPSSSRPQLEEPFVAPRTPLEQTLAGIWAEVLEIDEVGIHDEFFELGGDSLRAAQVLSRLSSFLNVNLPIERLLETPTVAKLAMAVTEVQAEEGEPDEVSRLLDQLEALSEEELLSRLAEMQAPEERHEG